MTRTQMLCLSALICLAAPLVLIVMIWFALRKNAPRFRQIALAMDCAGNAALNGDYRETISSRAGRRWPRMASVINWMFNDAGHCWRAVVFTREETTRGM